MTDEPTPDSAPPPPPSPGSAPPETAAPGTTSSPSSGPPPSGSPPPGPGSPGTAAPNRGLMLVLAYLWLLAVVPLLMEEQDQDVRWHAKHGLVLFGAEFAAFIALAIVSGIAGWLGHLLFHPAQLTVLVLHVVCIAKALQGDRFLIPGVSEYTDRF